MKLSVAIVLVPHVAVEVHLQLVRPMQCRRRLEIYDGPRSRDVAVLLDMVEFANEVNRSGYAEEITDK